jgi:ubiquinol-cytochrome c reductase cytochrome b subunit
VIAAVVILHIWALHIPGSGNPTGVDVKTEKDTLPFHPFYTAKDWLVRRPAFVLLYALVTYFAPNYLGHPDNYIPANPLATPAHIVPNGISGRSTRSCAPSRSTSSCRRSCGACWRCSLDPAAVLPAVARQVAGALGPLPAGVQALLLAAVIDVIVLGYVGGAEINALNIALGQLATAYYFAHFPDRPAAGFQVRTAAAAAVVHLRKRAARREAGSGAHRPDEAGELRGTRDHGPISSAFLVGVSLRLGGADQLLA